LSAPSRGNTGFSNVFVYNPGPQPGFRGRLSVGRSGVYVPYYGNVSGDPTHPSVQGGVGGIGFGYRSWDVSVVNGGYTGASAAPGAESFKSNPSLSFSIHF
jgi:hypothetical protein